MTRALRRLVPAVALAACASNDKVEITDEEYDDIAISVATTVRTDDGGGELGALADARTLATGMLPAGFTADADGGFLGVRGDVSYHYEITCRDAADVVLATCGPTTHDADFTVTWAGALTVPYDARVLARTGDWTLRDLDGELGTLNGAAEVMYETEYENPTRGVTTSYEVEHHARYLDVQLVPGTALPRAGQIRYLIEAERTRASENNQDTRDIELSVVVKLDGSARAILELGDADDKETEPPRRTYDLDVTTGALVRTSGLHTD